MCSDLLSSLEFPGARQISQALDLRRNAWAKLDLDWHRQSANEIVLRPGDVGHLRRVQALPSLGLSPTAVRRLGRLEDATGFDWFLLAGFVMARSSEQLASPVPPV